MTVDKPSRLDKFLAVKLACSRSQAAQIIANGAVKVNSRTINKVSHKVLPEDEVVLDSVSLILNKPEELSSEEVATIDFGIDILYQDDDFLVINKPAGLLVHKGSGKIQPTVVDWYKSYMGEGIDVGEEGREGIVHRLDQATSGALALAKKQESLKYLQILFKHRKVAKSYLALVHGNLSSSKARIEYSIGRDPRDRRKYRRDASGREAITEYEVLWSNGLYSLLKVDILTGRTHQIRVHLREIGHPVCGDTVYGIKDGMANLMLHSWRLAFIKVDGCLLEVTAAPSSDFVKTLEQLGLKDPQMIQLINGK